MMLEAKQTWQGVESDPEDGLAEEVHHVEDGGRELEEVLTLAIEEEPLERSGVLTGLAHLLDDLKLKEVQNLSSNVLTK